MGKKNRDKKDQEESRRILERINRETEPQILHTASRARDHLAAREAGNADWTELWGRRIGRACSVIFAIGLAIWLVAYLTGGI